MQKIIYSSKTPKELFDEAVNYMVSPVKKTIFVSKEHLDASFLLSGESALSLYSNLNRPNVEYYASDSISKYERGASNRLIDNDEQFALELWRYDPHKLATNACVDKLSLALSLLSNKDERIEQAVEKMLSETWNEIDDKRNRHIQEMVQRV